MNKSINDKIIRMMREGNGDNMQKVDKPKKPLFVYYLIALTVVILLNTILVPRLAKQKVTEVDYGTFLTMLSDKEVSKVELSGDEIYFQDKDNQFYSTNTFEDVNLVDRLQEAGCEFGQVKQQTMSPMLPDEEDGRWRTGECNVLRKEQCEDLCGQ